MKTITNRDLDRDTSNVIGWRPSESRPFRVVPLTDLDVDEWPDSEAGRPNGWRYWLAAVLLGLVFWFGLAYLAGRALGG